MDKVRDYKSKWTLTFLIIRPPYCPEVDQSLCAVMYDSNDCLGGWDLPIKDGEERWQLLFLFVIIQQFSSCCRNLYYFSSDWRYRNDVDTIGLRRGCTFNGFTSTGFSGDKMTFTANETDKYVHIKKEI